MRGILRHSCAKLFLSLFAIALFSLSAYSQCRLLNETFDNPPNLASTNTDGAWYPDRYPPAGFTNTNLSGQNVLDIHIDGTNDGLASRPPAYQSTFYNTQGRKFNQCGTCVTVMKGDLYIPSDWATKHRRSDMWASAYDATNTLEAYPIIGFRNIDGTSPGIYYFDGHLNGGNGDWVNTGVTITYDSWYHLQFRIVAGNFEFLVNNTVVGTISADGSTYFGDVMLQAYNFNDATIPASSGTPDLNSSTNSYDAYWDNVMTTATGGNFVLNTNTGVAYCTIQAAIDAASAGDVIKVFAGTYHEDVNVNKSVTLKGSGPDQTTVSGPIGGSSSTFAITANNVVIDSFKITRDGNNTTDWNNPNLNSAGISIQGQAITGSVIKNNLITGNRTGIDVNNSNGHSVLNNNITDNRTGLIFRNQTDNMIVENNFITNNWTDGIVFLDGSGGTNSPVQTAANSSFNYNNISGNWYGQVVDRQSGGSLPAPGSNQKNFTCNWWGTTSPVVTTANSSEPGYAAQIPVEFGGTATPPGGQPDIAGPASANIIYIPYLTSGVDADGVTPGFQPVANSCSGGTHVHNITQGTHYVTIQQGVNAANNGDVLVVDPGTYTEQVEITKSITINGSGIGVTNVVSPNTLPLSFTTPSGVNHPIIYVHNATVVINNLTVDGQGKGSVNNKFVGIGYATAGGTISNCEIKGIRENPANGVQHGVGIYAYSSISSPATTRAMNNTGNQTVLKNSKNKISPFDDGFSTSTANNALKTNIVAPVANTLTITNNSITDFQKNGMVLSGDNLKVNVSNNTVTGAGEISYIAQNGIQVSSGASGSVNTNTVSGFVYTPNTVVSCGILILGPNGTVNTMGNNVSASQVGIYYISTSGSIQNNTVDNSTVSTASYGIDVENGTTPISQNSVSSNSNGTGIEADYTTGDNTNATIQNNIVNNNGTGVLIWTDGLGGSANTPIHYNSITNSGTYAIQNLGSSTVDATCNWYGTTDASAIAAKISGPVTYIPYLVNGTDADGSTPGFQSVANTCTGGTHVHDITTNTHYITIQQGVNGANAGDTLVVDPGTYTETVTVTKSLVIKGANYGVSCSGSRSAESIVNGSSSGATFNIQADRVTIDGFKITNPTGSLGITESGRSFINIQHNIITDIGNTTTGSGSSWGVDIEVGTSVNSDSVRVSANCINNIRGGQGGGTPGSAGGIIVGSNPDTKVLTHLALDSNRIDHISANQASKGAYGILIDVHGVGGSVPSANILNNEINTLEALWAHGIGLEGATPTATVSNNAIRDLVSHNVAFNDATAVNIESNSGSSSVAINDNSFTNSTYAIIVNPANPNPDSVHATCNWYGTVDTTAIKAKLFGPIIWKPYLVTGSDASASNPGFQPQPNSCTGAQNAPLPQFNATLSSINATCYGGSGSINVSNVSGGTPPYTFSLDGNTYVSQPPSGPTFPSVPAGVYNVYVKDANGTTDIVGTVTITQPSPIMFSVTQGTPPNCANGSTTSLTVNASGGTGTYTYKLDNGTPQSSNVFTTGAGTHNVTVTDAAGCSSSTTVTVNGVSSITFNSVNVTNSTCYNGISGQIAVNATGAGTMTYTLSKPNGTQSTQSAPSGTTVTFTGLGAGNYTITAVDANNCPATATASVSQPAQMNAPDNSNGAPDLLLTSVINPPTATFTSGSVVTITYTISVKNNSNNSAQGVIIRITKPFSGYIVTASGNSWTKITDNSTFVEFQLKAGLEVPCSGSVTAGISITRSGNDSSSPGLPVTATVRMPGAQDQHDQDNARSSQFRVQ